MSIGRIDLGNGCYEYFADGGDTAWIVVYQSNGCEVKQIGHWHESPDTSEWADGPFRSEEEAWASVDKIRGY